MTAIENDRPEGIHCHQAAATPVGTLARLTCVKTGKLVQVVRRDIVVHYICWDYSTRARTTWPI